MLVVNRGCRMPARTLLKFEPVLGDPGSLPAPDTKVWTAADHKHGFCRSPPPLASRRMAYGALPGRRPPYGPGSDHRMLPERGCDCAQVRQQTEAKFKARRG